MPVPAPELPPPTPVPPPADIKGPVVTLTVLRSGKSSNYTVTTKATDAVGVTRFEVKLDGAPISRTPGVITITIRTKGQHVITAQGWDAAGNASVLASQTVTR